MNKTYFVLGILIVLLSFNSYAGKLDVTLEHPFLIEGEWIPALELEEGDVLTLVDGRKAVITKITDLEKDEPFLVYNFEDDFGINNYAVGDGVVVHNSNREQPTGEFKRAFTGGRMNNPPTVKYGKAPVRAEVLFLYFKSKLQDGFRALTGLEVGTSSIDQGIYLGKFDHGRLEKIFEMAAAVKAKIKDPDKLNYFLNLKLAFREKYLEGMTPESRVNALLALAEFENNGAKNSDITRLFLNTRHSRWSREMLYLDFSEQFFKNRITEILNSPAGKKIANLRGQAKPNAKDLDTAEQEFIAELVKVSAALIERKKTARGIEKRLVRDEEIFTFGPKQERISEQFVSELGYSDVAKLGDFFYRNGAVCRHRSSLLWMLFKKFIERKFIPSLEETVGVVKLDIRYRHGLVEMQYKNQRITFDPNKKLVYTDDPSASDISPLLTALEKNGFSILDRKNNVYCNELICE